jgi:patatin-like phospholipase/acyl hydrolase
VRNGKIHVELLGKFGSSEELDRSTFKSIDRILPEVDRSNKRRSIKIFQNLLLQKRARTPNQEFLHDKKQFSL